MKVILIMLLSVNFVWAEGNPGQSLLNYFGATCASQGNWTQLALSDARNLINTIQTIRDDDDCKTVAGAVASLGNLENKLNLINSEFTYQLEVASLEAQEIELLSQLSQVTDAGIRSDIEATLRSIQLDKASYVALSNEMSHYNGGELRHMYSALVNSTAQAYKTIVANQLCLNKYPSLLSSATALSSSIAASSAMINPALGIGLASVTDFIGNTVEYFRSRGYNISIRNVSNGSTILEGLKCAMESLSNRWCDINEAENFLNFEAGRKDPENLRSELNVISDLYDVDIPVLLNWLEKVKAGAPAANTADAQRRRGIIFRRAMVEGSIFLGQGIFSEQRPLYDQAVSFGGKFGVIRSVVNKIRSEIPSESSSILTDIINYEFVPFYLIGLDTIPNQGGDPSRDLVNWNNYDPKRDTPNYVPDFQVVVNRYKTWMEAAQDRVTQEYSLVSQPDPLQILSTYSERTSNIWKKAPVDAVKNIIKFIKENRPSITSSRFEELYDTTVKKLETIDNAVFGNFEPESGCDDDGDNGDINGDGRIIISDLFENNQIQCDKQLLAIEIIFKEAQLETGVIVFLNRLETIIRVAIDQFIQNAEDKDQDHIATLLAANSYLDALKVISGTDSYAQILFDLQKAKPIALNNMQNFTEFFGLTINQLFMRNEANLNSTDPTIAQTYRDDRAHMCFLLAAMPTWPKKVFKRYCYGMQLESMQVGGPSTPVITEEFLNQPFKERSCIYRDYLERSKIYQLWGIKL